VTKAIATKTDPADDAIIVPAYADVGKSTIAKKFQADHEAVEKHVCAFRIESAEDAEKAAAWAEDITKRRDMVAEELAPATDMRRAANKISAKWNPAIHPLDRALEHLRLEQGRFITESRAAVAVALPQATSTEEIVAAAALLSPPPATVQVRESWSAEVTMTPAQTVAALLALGDERVANILAASLPSAYLLVDQSRLNAEARSLHEAFAVPGARAVKAVTVAHVGR
jgi:hypothetical protein